MAAESTEVKDLIIKHLSVGHMMQLATVHDGQPWCCTVYYAADDNQNLFWVSTPGRRHSREMEEH